MQQSTQYSSYVLAHFPPYGFLVIHPRESFSTTAYPRRPWESVKPKRDQVEDGSDGDLPLLGGIQPHPQQQQSKKNNSFDYYLSRRKRRFQKDMDFDEEKHQRQNDDDNEHCASSSSEEDYRYSSSSDEDPLAQRKNIKQGKKEWRRREQYDKRKERRKKEMKKMDRCRDDGLEEDYKPAEDVRLPGGPVSKSLDGMSAFPGGAGGMNVGQNSNGFRRRNIFVGDVDSILPPSAHLHCAQRELYRCTGLDLPLSRFHFLEQTPDYVKMGENPVLSRTFQPTSNALLGGGRSTAAGIGGVQSSAGLPNYYVQYKLSSTQSSLLFSNESSSYLSTKNTTMANNNKSEDQCFLATRGYPSFPSRQSKESEFNYFYVRLNTADFFTPSSSSISTSTAGVASHYPTEESMKQHARILSHYFSGMCVPHLLEKGTTPKDIVLTASTNGPLQFTLKLDRNQFRAWSFLSSLQELIVKLQSSGDGYRIACAKHLKDIQLHQSNQKFFK